MLPGFEDITYELTELELSFVPGFVKGFRKHIGKGNAVTNDEICAAYDKKGIKMSASRVRKIVNYIRNTHLVDGLIATSKGYYISVDKEEIQKYVQSLQSRENEIRRVKEKMQNYLNKICL